MATVEQVLTNKLRPVRVTTVESEDRDMRELTYLEVPDDCAELELELDMGQPDYWLTPYEEAMLLGMSFIKAIHVE